MSKRFLLSEVMRNPPWRSPLNRRTVLMLTGAMLVLQVALTLQNFQSSRAQMFEDLRENARRYMVSAIDRRKFPDNETLVGIGENLEFATTIEGGVFTDAIGDDVVVFGERPDLTWQVATIQGRTWRFQSANRTYEVYLSPETLGISYGILLRLDASEMHARQMAYVRSTLLQGMLTVLFTGLVAALLMTIKTVAPMRRMIHAAGAASRQPKEATANLLQFEDETEIGVLGHLIDDLMRALASTFDDDRAQRAWVFDQAGFATLVYSGGGQLVDANLEALELFQAETVEELAAMDQNKLIRIGGKLRKTRSLFKQGRFESSGEAVVRGQSVPCIVTGDSMRRDDGSVRGHFIAMTNVEPMVKDMRRERQARQRVEREFKLSQHRLREFKQVFESCLLLMDANAAEAPKMKITLMPEELINGWHKEHVESMMMTGGDVRYATLPPVIGCPHNMRKIIRQSLTIVQKRAHLIEGAIIRINGGVVDGDAVEIIIRAVEGHDDGRTAINGDTADAPILIAGLSRMLTANGGTLVRSTAANDKRLNELVFRLPLDVDTHRASKNAQLTAGPGAPEVMVFDGEDETSEPLPEAANG